MALDHLGYMNCLLSSEQSWRVGFTIIFFFFQLGEVWYKDVLECSQGYPDSEELS